MLISVVIPAFNNWKLTQRCIQTLLRCTPSALLAEIVVVDDASTDGETPAWTTAQERITPLLLERNRGFSGACNAGAAVCSGDAILFLNNDAFARPGAVSTLRDVLASDTAIGIAGARLVYADGSLQHAGLAMLPGAVSAWWHVHKRRDAQLADASIARDIFAVTGAALLIRRTLFDQLGGFDEGFVNGWEDVDLCLRAWCRGARVRYEPRAILEHLESATLGHNRNHERNEQRFVERWQSILGDAPRYPLPEVPPIALAVGRQSAAADTWALAHIGRSWKAHLGAVVVRTRPASRIDRARVDLLAAVARRRPTLEISWGDACLAPPTGTQRIAFVTPRSAAEAAAYVRAAAITAWWTPTDVARGRLCAAGAPPDRVTVVRLGTESAEPPARSGPPAVAAYAADAAMLKRLTGEFPGVRTATVGPDARPLLGGIDIFFAPNGGDRYGLSLAAAIGQGCSVVTSPPVDTLLAAAPGVTIVDESLLYDALRANVGKIEALRAAAADLYLDAQRCLDAFLGTRHVAELARATTGGTPSMSLVEVDSMYARRLRGARGELAICE